MSLAILIPVLGRPQQIKPVLASIKEATSVPHRVIFICSPDDPTTKLCRRTEAEVMTTPWQPGRADFAKKVNLGYDNSEEEWLFQAATDLKFHPNWDIHALDTARRRKAGVVGTNDLGNPAVKRGQHSTHTLFSRAYIQEYGGTIDNSGSVLSEVYDHQWCDNEFVQTAKGRRQWAFAQYSIVEHNHPHWGKGEMDATYEKALRETIEDRNLFHSRMILINPNSPQARRMRQLAARREMLTRRRRI